MCGSCYPTYPKSLPPTLIFFSKFWSLKKTWSEKYSKAGYLKNKTKGPYILKDFFF